MATRPGLSPGQSFLSKIFPNQFLGSGSLTPRPHAGDEEQAGHANAAPGFFPPQQTKPASNAKVALVNSQDKLSLFRSLVGIHTPEILHDGNSWFSTGRAAPNVGIYERVIKAEAKSHRDYKVFSFLISFCLGAQILVAACLTALGAGSGPNSAVTVFGAINTVFSGFLAYLKGSGLPNRLKYYESEWTKVREYIEQRERDFCRDGCLLDPESEISTIRRMYETVKSDVEANTPDSFISVRDIAKHGGVTHPGPSLAHPAQAANQFVDATADRVHDRFVAPTEKGADMLQRNLSYQSSRLGREISQYGEKIHEYGGQAASLKEKAMAYGDKLHDFAEHAGALKDRVVSFGHDASSRFGHDASRFEDNVSHIADRPYTIDVNVGTHHAEPKPKEKETYPSP